MSWDWRGWTPPAHRGPAMTMQDERFGYAEPELTIEPVVGWRTWAVSSIRPWEEGSGVVLRGAWGRPWTGPRLTARCLRAPMRPAAMLAGLIKIVEDVESDRHSTPAPEPACRCGIYAEKPDAVGETHIPRLDGVPQVNGLVELSGVVIEAVRGYRAQRAEVIGPLELHMTCAGTVDDSRSCPNPPVELQNLNDTPRAYCTEHADMVEGRSRLGFTDWLDTVVADLQAKYQSPVFTFEKGGSHGHR